MALGLRLQPFLWSGRQILACSTLVGAACGALAGMIDVWPFMPKSGAVVNFVVQFVWKIVLLGGISSLFCGFAAVSRNILARIVYGRQRLETLRATPWSYGELALAGFWAFAVLPSLVVLGGTRLFGVTVSSAHFALTLLEFAAFGALYLVVVGAARNRWVSRHGT